MESIWKTVLAFAVIILITSAGLSITAANVEIVTAGDYMEEVSAVIRESYYSESVITACAREAEKNGYFLEVELYEDSEYSTEKYARVRLHYPYRIPVFNIFQWKTREKII